MDIFIDQLLSNSFVLSIDNARIELLKKIFDYHKLRSPRVFNGYANSDLKPLFSGNINDKQQLLANAYNCSLGHTAIIKMAKCLDLPYVLVFEDDAYPCKDICQQLEINLKNLPDDIECLILGWSWLARNEKKISNTLTQLHCDEHGSHAYVIFKKGYDKYLSLYSSNPKIPSDLILTKFTDYKHTYRTNKCLFIQYNIQKSNWGCIGYTYESEYRQYRSDIVPNGFIDIRKIIEQEKMPQQTQKSQLEKTAARMQQTFKTDRKSVIVIGSNPSIKDFQAMQYIDNNESFIIRLNRPPIKDCIQNYGEKTDLFIGCEYLKNQLKDVSNKFLISHPEILEISKQYVKEKDKWLTTGFIAILLALQLFDKVEIFGFGYANKKEDDIGYSSICETMKKTHHLMNYEHKLIQQFIDVDFKGRLTRFEDGHKDLKI